MSPESSRAGGPTTSAGESAAPQLSAVIASRHGRPYIDDCLASLARQIGGVRAEVVVADQVGRSVTDFIRAEYPDVRLIEFPVRQGVPKLRAAGILAACGDIITITSDHCVAPVSWFEAIARAHSKHPGPAIGGAVDNAVTGRSLDWAVYFCEYSNFISPAPGGAVHDLPGPNVSYKRSALVALPVEIESGYRETWLHRRLETAGHRLWSDPSIVVQFKKRFGFVEFLACRFHYGRWYAGTRNEGLDRLRRWAQVCLSPLLPPSILARITRRVLSRRRHIRPFIAALPLITLFVVAGAAGEFVGGLLGPGESVLELY